MIALGRRKKEPLCIVPSCVCERQRETDTERERDRETSGARGRLQSAVCPVRAGGIRPQVPPPASVCICGVPAGEYQRGLAVCCGVAGAGVGGGASGKELWPRNPLSAAHLPINSNIPKGHPSRGSAGKSSWPNLVF